MDKPIQWTDEMDRFFRNAPEETNRALRNAYDEMLLRRQDPSNMFDPTTGTFTNIPNLRTFDYLKRGFDRQIGSHLAQGQGGRAMAAALSDELGQIKRMLIEQNPEYGQILATQRDLFQQARAIELGESAMKQLRSDPRKLLRTLNGLEPAERLNARIGIIDSLMAMDTKADPINFFQSVYRNDAQRKIFEFAFGGKEKLDDFAKYVTREARARRSDVLTAPGRQSETSRIALAADDEIGGSSNVFLNAMRGYAFGGAVGAASGAIRTIQNIAHGVTHFAQEEIAKILMSKGEDLVSGIGGVKKYMERRERTNKRLATLIAKGGQQGFTSMLEGQ